MRPRNPSMDGVVRHPGRALRPVWFVAVMAWTSCPGSGLQRPDAPGSGVEDRADPGLADETIFTETVDSVVDTSAQEPVMDITTDGTDGNPGKEPESEASDPTEPPTDDDANGSRFVDPGDDAPVLDEGTADSGPWTAAACFAKQWPASGVPPIDYDPFHPQIGSHCKGTNHQDIQGVQRVVFAGDSITTGTPPTPMADWYRNRLADALATKWGLKPPGLLWRMVDLLGSGKTLEMHSGDFWSCAKFGARTDDLLLDPHKQFITCNPPEERKKTTLIVMTIGGNDLFAWAQDLADGVSIDKIWAKALKAVEDLEAAIHWAVDDPETFPNGVFIVFANTYEFSDLDSGKDLADCPGAGIISMDTALIDPEFQAMSRYFTTEYMRIAVETGTDLVFFGEHACGHGYMYDNPEGRCYRGPGAALWLDITCMHPGSAGHAGLYDLFLSVIEE